MYSTPYILPKAICTLDDDTKEREERYVLRQTREVGRYNLFNGAERALWSIQSGAMTTGGNYQYGTT